MMLELQGEEYHLEVEALLVLMPFVYASLTFLEFFQWALIGLSKRAAVGIRGRR